MNIRIGQGYDVHQLVEGRDLILGGVKIPFEKGLLGHSDADALLHAITDALLGAAGLGDIGSPFPPTAAAGATRARTRQTEDAKGGVGAGEPRRGGKDRGDEGRIHVREDLTQNHELARDEAGGLSGRVRAEGAARRRWSVQSSLQRKPKGAILELV